MPRRTTLLAKLLVAAVFLSIPAVSFGSFNGQVYETKSSVNPSSFYQYRFSGDLLQRKGNKDRAWTSKSFKPLPASSIRAKMFNELKSAKAGNQQVAINYIVGRSVPRSMLSAYKKQMKQAIDFYDLSGLQKPIDILIFTEKDTSVLRDYWQPRWHGDEQIGRKLQNLEFYKKEPLNRSVGGASDVRQLKDGSYPTLGIDFYMGSRHTPERHLLVEHVAHEMAHVWQWHAMGVAEKMASEQRFDLMSLIPCHAMEGAATTLGITVAVPFNDWYAEASDVIIRRIARDSNIKKMTPSLAIQLLNKSENWATCEEGYAVGMLAYEWFIAQYGAEKFFELYEGVGDFKSFSHVMEEVSGLTENQFYSGAAKHISDTFNNALKKRD